MYLTEKHVVKKDNVNFEVFGDLCHKSALLYNKALYNIRQEIINKKKITGRFDMTKMFAKADQPDYRLFPAQTSQMIIFQVYDSIKSFYRALESYNRDKSKFTGKPKLPKYKKANIFKKVDGKSEKVRVTTSNIITFNYQQVSIKNGYIHFPKKVNIKPVKTNVENIKVVRIIPLKGYFKIEVVYKKEEELSILNPDNILSIDMGVNNFASCVSNAMDAFIISGKEMKSFNCRYNMLVAEYQSYVKNKGKSKRLSSLHFKRNMWFLDKLHKISRYIVDTCIKNDIGCVVVGKNKMWKQKSKLGKKTNSKFVPIPHAMFINLLKYKCELKGIRFLTVEESYTSVCDNLAGEKLSAGCSKGKRLKRGLYQSSTGVLINADINGAIGIGRKIFKRYEESVTSSGVNLTPRVIRLSCKDKPNA